MKNILKWVLIPAIALNFYSHETKYFQNQELREVTLNDPIKYKDFSSIDFNEEPDKMIYSIYQRDFHNKNLSSNYSEIGNKRKLEKVVFNEINQITGLEGKKEIRNMITKLSPQKSLDLSIDIVNNIFEHVDVDKKSEFSLADENLYIEDYMDLGKGDCQRYTWAFEATFNLFKKYNKNLERIFINDSYYGGGSSGLNHEWNSIFFNKNDTLIVTHLDLTFYDNGGSLEGKKGYHFSENDFKFKTKLILANSWEKDNRHNTRKQIVLESSSSGDREFALEMMALYAYQDEDSEHMQEIRELSNKENCKCNEKEVKDEILYYSYLLEKKKENFDQAEEYKKQLLEGYPNSYWASEVKD